MTDDGDNPAKRSLFKSLRARTIFLLSIALMPIGLIAIYQTYQLSAAAERNSELALLALTQQAANDQRIIIERTFAYGNLIASVADQLLDDPEACDDSLKSYVADRPDISLVGIITPDGQMQCSSSGARWNFAGTPEMEAALADPRERITVNRDGPISEASVIVASLPFETEDTIGGFITISVPHAELTGPTNRSNLPYDGLRDLITLSNDGTILAARGDLDDADQNMPDTLDISNLPQTPHLKTGAAVDGKPSIYTFVPIGDQDVTVMGVWNPQNPNVRALQQQFLSPIVFPVLMWLASILVALLALYTLVIRHVTSLRQQMDSFASRRTVPAINSTSDLPSEIADVQGHFLSMTDDILREEARLEEMVREKNILLKEIHHRVKNNLQMIASVMNMQIRAAKHEETAENLERIQNRVIGLADIHEELYATQSGGRIDVGSMIKETLAKSTRHFQARDNDIRVHSDIATVLLFPDQTLSLSLLASEAITNAIKYARTTDGGPPEISVSLDCVGKDCILRVKNSCTGDPPESQTGIGTKLMKAFAIRLGSELQSSNTDGFYEVIVKFGMQDFEAANLDY